jgi:ribonuclease VapC
VIVVDSSAVVAILRLEPEADVFLKTIVDADRVEMSSVGALEVSLVLAGARGGEGEWSPFEEFVERKGIIIVPLDLPQMKLARAAFLRFGRGRHPAALNLGDCAAYALAAMRGAPLLFKGSDFSRTDLIMAVPGSLPH